LNYLNYRSFQTVQSKAINKISLKKGSNGITASPLQIDMIEFEKKFMSKSKKVIESPALVEFIDMPEIYHYNDKAFEPFFSNLAKTHWYDIF
jgi:hypothetical protein